MEGGLEGLVAGCLGAKVSSLGRNIGLECMDGVAEFNKPVTWLNFLTLSLSDYIWYNGCTNYSGC